MTNINERLEKCGWYGGCYGPMVDGHWHCYCKIPSKECKIQIETFAGVHLKENGQCPHKNLCGLLSNLEAKRLETKLSREK